MNALSMDIVIMDDLRPGSSESRRYDNGSFTPVGLLHDGEALSGESHVLRETLILASERRKVRCSELRMTGDGNESLQLTKMYGAGI